MPQARLHQILIPLAALIVILPLLLHGPSCGHDFDFHITNWLEAQTQLLHGSYPHWAYTPAYNAGEPRFVFYPPISWITGAALGLILPWAWTPIVYTWLILTLSGFTLHSLARRYASPTAALLGSIFYLANPYMLFTAFERTAYAELLAAAWFPLLLRAILAPTPTIPSLALPLALLWITNAPAAVVGTYALALLTFIRLASPKENTLVINPLSSIQLALTAAAGTALGLGLAAFYILPAAFQRRFVNIQMAIPPGLRPTDNFLFRHTGDPDHDAVLRTVSIIAILLLALTTAALLLAKRTSATRNMKLPLALLAITIAFLLTPLSSPIWNHAPQLLFLQFPWRVLALLAAALCLALSLALSHLHLKPLATTAITLALSALLTYPASRFFRQTCYPEDTVPARVALFHSGTGSEPTDEYAPIHADNDSLSQNNPPFRLSPDPTSQPGPTSPPGPAPHHLTLNSPTPQTLILNLRDYPNWRIALNGATLSTRLHRADGLIAIPVPAGSSTIDFAYFLTTDQIVGIALSILALATLLCLHRSARTGKRLQNH